jgi:hypothetical protein
MVTNLFVPLYQDYSAIGRITSLGIRSVWIFVGGIFQVFLTIPVLLYVIIIFILPVVPIVMIASSFI